MSIKRPDATYRTNQQYVLRVLAGIAGWLVVAIGLVRFWPAPGAGPVPTVFSSEGKDAITLEMIEPTVQTAKPPPPPAPLPPIPVPDDIVFDEEYEILDEIANDIGTEPSEDETGEDEVSQGPALVARPDEAPKPVRFVEPEYSPEARRRKIRAEITVEVLVNEKGRVTESRIVDRFLVERRDERKPVTELGYGLE
ncbi:MAG: energy transducer TonB, partial [Bacteroidota bacterium]